MRLLTENEMLELVSATPSDREFLADRLACLLGPDEHLWLKSAVQESDRNIVTVVHRGRRVGAIWWWYSPGNKALVLNAGASFVQDNTTPAFLRAYEMLAKQTGARSLELQTARPGVVKIYRQAGFKIEAVQMRKIL